MIHLNACGNLLERDLVPRAEPRPRVFLFYFTRRSPHRGRFHFVRRAASVVRTHEQQLPHIPGPSMPPSDRFSMTSQEGLMPISRLRFVHAHFASMPQHDERFRANCGIVSRAGTIAPNTCTRAHVRHTPVSPGSHRTCRMPSVQRARAIVCPLSSHNQIEFGSQWPTSNRTMSRIDNRALDRPNSTLRKAFI
jgi:hypothetical protein